MVQRAPNARERFETAAMSLFQERGYARTTVPEIAARAELTERTFYRYFADKPEVLFWRANALLDTIVSAIANAPAHAWPLEAVTGALETAGAVFDENRSSVKVRHALVAAHPDFQERDMMKSRALASAIEAILQGRGVRAPAARVVSEAGVAIWRVAVEWWNSDEAERDFPHHVRSALDELQMVVVGHGIE